MVTGRSCALFTGRVPARREQPPGYSLLELLFAAAVITILSAAAVPSLLATVESTRVRGAARYLASRLQQARLEALKRACHVGFRFDADGSYQFRLYADGNGDGLRTRDITSGVDPPLGASERLDAQFAGVTFGILDGVSEVDSSALLGAGSDPIRLGSSDILSFGPLGTATAGTLYLQGRGREQYAVRVLGVTGRVRVLRFDFASRQWVSP
jgi:prepilin-type N-terminal cleavage/methylation domain-containing protein